MTKDPWLFWRGGVEVEMWIFGKSWVCPAWSSWKGRRHSAGNQTVRTIGVDTIRCEPYEGLRLQIQILYPSDDLIVKRHLGSRLQIVQVCHVAFLNSLIVTGPTDTPIFPKKSKMIMNGMIYTCLAGSSSWSIMLPSIQFNLSSFSPNSADSFFGTWFWTLWKKPGAGCREYPNHPKSLVVL